MAESIARIQALLRGLSRREQRVLLLRAAFGAVAAWCVAWAGLAAAVSWDVATRAWGPAWLLLLALSGIVVAAVPLRALREARSARRQALRVEALRPELQGALLTVLDRSDVPRGSPVLLGRLASRAATVVETVPPPVVHPPGPARRLALLAALALAVLGLAGLLLPRGPMEALAALTAPVIEPAAEAAPPAPDGPRALVGDITLRYLYPTYTGREPMEVPNSNGEVHAPPGTRVEIRARTAEAYPAAALVAYGGEPEAVEITDGRSLRGAFTVAGAGSWRFQFGVLPSPDYAIVPDPDLPPDVAVQAPDRKLSQPVDKDLPLQWTARDDFGITRVVVEVDDGGRKREVEVRKPLEVPRELGAVLGLTPKDLGLAAGSNAKIRVGAWDNDEVSGSKAGWSAPIEVEVLGPHGESERANRYRRLLRDALVLVLSDFLLDPSPPAGTGAEVAAWGATAATRYDGFDRLVREAWGGEESDTFDTTVLRALREDRRSLFAFTSSLAPSARVSDADLAALVSLQQDHVATVENAVLMLDQVIRAAALANVAELVSQAAEEAQELKQDFAKLDKGAALARLDQLERLYQQLMREAAKLDEGQFKDFLNDRSKQVQSMMDEIRKALREGRMDDAKALMDRLADTMQKMADQVEDMQEQKQKSSEDLQKAMEAVKGELEALEGEQRLLRQKTEKARAEHGPDMDEAVKAWEEVERLAGTVVSELAKVDGADEALRASSWGGASLLEEAQSDAGGLHDSARARDLETALPRADQVYGELGMLTARIGNAQRRGNAPPESLAAAQRVVEAQKKNVARIRDLLDKMADRQARTSPALQQDLRDMAQEQQDLADRAQKTTEHAQRLAENLPMDAPGLQDGAKRGAEQAARAAEALKNGQPMPAEGGQRAAEEGFRQALDALDEASRNLQQMQQASRGGGRKNGSRQGEGEGGDRSGNGESTDGGEMALPAPEAFRTPEEYRRALLEGMSGDVPEEYKALNRRYYEELVRQ